MNITLIGRIDNEGNITNHVKADDERTVCGLRFRIMQTQKARDDDQLTCGRCRQILAKQEWNKTIKKLIGKLHELSCPYETCDMQGCNAYEAVATIAAELILAGERNKLS